MAAEGKPHAVCIPYPAQGHINPMFKLAKLLHRRGFYVTFVNTEYNHRRLLNSRGQNSLDGVPDFRFESIPDGLPSPSAESDIDVTQDIPSLSDSTSKNCLAPFCSLISRLINNNMPDFIPPVTCIVSDGVMSFTLKAAQQFGLPEVLFWTTSACGFLGYANYRQLIQRGYFPLKDMSYVNNGYLETTTLDWVQGAKGIMRLKDFPSFLRTTDRNDIMFNFLMKEAENVQKSSVLILNTFDALEHDVLEALSERFPRIFTIGSLQLMLNQMDDETRLKSIILGNSNLHLWKEEPGCIDWLNTKEPNSVVYVNFGSIAVMSGQQLTEFAWGLANSKKSFLWIIRPDALVQSEGRGMGTGTEVTLPPEFVNKTKDRGMMASWCPQEQVLKHPAIGGFLTHSGWNSTLESICSGVPVICWPFFAEQPTNCRYCCVEWGVGMEIDTDVKRDEVDKLVRELMEGEKGKELKKNAMDWKQKAERAAAPGGSSNLNFDRLLELLLLPN